MLFVWRESGPERGCTTPASLQDASYEKNCKVCPLLIIFLYDVNSQLLRKPTNVVRVALGLTFYTYTVQDYGSSSTYSFYSK